MRIKTVILLTATVLTSLSATAQEQVFGSVTDKYGIGLPNVHIEIVGTRTETTTNLNGGFITETNARPERLRFSALGKKTITRSYEPGMSVTMKQLTWWNERPTRWSFFIGPDMMTDFAVVPMGLRVGIVRDFGFYAFFNTTTGAPKTIGKTSDHNGSSLYTNKHMKRGATIFGGGAMWRLWCPIYLYGGAGIMKEKLYMEHLKNSRTGETDGYVELENYDDDSNGLVLESGLMLALPHLYVSAGAGFPMEQGTFMLHSSIGIRF